MVLLPVLWIFNRHKRQCMQLHTGVVRTSSESLHWKLTVGENSLAASRTQTCISIAPGFWVGCSTNWAIPAPINIWPDQRLLTSSLSLSDDVQTTPVCNCMHCLLCLLKSIALAAIPLFRCTKILYTLIAAGAGIAQWLERQTHDWKVAGSNPCWSGRRIFFSRVDFLCWLLFRYPFHPCVTAVARKRSQSFCQKCGWQVTAKHAYTFRMWLCMKWHGAWLYGVHITCAKTAAVSCRTSHASAVSTPLWWIFKKTRYEKLVTHVEPHASAVSLLKRAENSAV